MTWSKIYQIPKLCTFQNVIYARRPISTTGINQCSNLVKKKALQTKFQCEDGKPIWLKAGMLDRILYSTTIISCFIGLFMDFHLIYDHAKPQSWRKPAD